jgi:predicted DNA-binding transcriptional regulator AlpA
MSKRLKRLLNSRQVKERYGNVSDQTIWRWLRDERLGFPKPEQIRRRNYWDSDKLDAFDERREHAA